MTARCGGVGRTLRRAAARLLLVSLAALAAAACGRTEPEACLLYTSDAADEL